MALQKSFTETTGAEYPAGYWRIVGVNTNYDNKSAELVVACYKDKSARDAKKAFIRSSIISYPIRQEADFDLCFPNKTIDLIKCYAYIKAFKRSTDVVAPDGKILKQESNDYLFDSVDV